MIDPGCKLYVKTSESRLDLLREVEQFFEGSCKGNMVETEALFLFVDNNDAAGEKAKCSEDEFLYYPFTIDMEPEEGVSQEMFIDIVNSLISHLLSHGCLVVSACDFEDELIC